MYDTSSRLDQSLGHWMSWNLHLGRNKMKRLAMPTEVSMTTAGQVISQPTVIDFQRRQGGILVIIHVALHSFLVIRTRACPVIGFRPGHKTVRAHLPNLTHALQYRGRCLPKPRDNVSNDHW